MTEVPEDQVRDLERGAEEMEQGLGRLEGDIETAHERAAEQRERANPEAAAGDWQDESTAAHQGDDASEASRSLGEEDGEGGGVTAVADAPVHEAPEVTPGDERDSGEGEGDGDSGDERDSGDDGPSGSVSMDDVPVHEAEQVDPGGGEQRESGDSGGDEQRESGDSRRDDGESGRDPGAGDVP